MTAYDLVEWKCHVESEILTGGNRQVTSKCPPVEIDECLGWNMTRGRRVTPRQQKAEQSWETEFELSSDSKSVCMRSFNNVNSSCILIQIEVYQAGKGELRKKRPGVSSHNRLIEAKQKRKKP